MEGLMCSLPLLFVLFCETGSLTEPKACTSVRLADQRNPRICQFLFPQCQGHRCLPATTPSFYILPGTQGQVHVHKASASLTKPSTTLLSTLDLNSLYLSRLCRCGFLQRDLGDLKVGCNSLHYVLSWWSVQAFFTGFSALEQNGQFTWPSP